MSDIIVKNLGKKYKRYYSKWTRLTEWLTANRYCGHESHWVLRNLDFKIARGESVGIVGQNGAGKSTLLKILTGTTHPTEGSVGISGKVSALLELGMGFHPDFSGRDNAIIACKMLGLNRDEIFDLLPKIQKFSELGDYFDQPLRVYSTGMQMRLAFSAATVVCPDVLIIDEALSVGDAYFQHKCIQKIRSFKQKGSTLLFVSHDPGAVKSLCDRAILLNQGEIIKDGAPDAVLDYYNGLIAKKNVDDEILQIENEHGKTITRSGSGKVRIQKVEMYNSKNMPARAFRCGDTAKIEIYIKFNSSMLNPTVGIMIRDRLGNDVFGTNTYHLNAGEYSFDKGQDVIVSFEIILNLGCANYSLTVGVHSGFSHLEENCDWWDQCIVFQIVSNDSYAFDGIASLPVKAFFKGV